MAYTNISKPTGTSYSNQNAIGKQQYDEGDIMYDDMNTYYDGVNYSEYTNVDKPSLGNSFTLVAGGATGLIMSPTYPATTTYTPTDPYTRVGKPN